uniref:Sulfotransferase n=2 Tax=Kalanchoe fedtschenkoi TaxID=63787 RepID=A0A7N0TWU0_KALFE
MDLDVKVFLALLLLGLVTGTFSQDDDYEKCERTVMEWKFAALDVDVKEDKHKLQELLFFLHVPRTGGRTYFHCFLKKLYPNALECPRSYDKLRLDPRKPNCRLLVTHDDYSMMSKLPRKKTSVVTILRNPIDRVFSTYEFSIEVAARFLIHPNLTSAVRMVSRIRKKTNFISTLDIWPWKYLVPWMREDLFTRRDVRKFGEHNLTESSDSYNLEDMAMPLHEYIKDPVAQDIIHNGATFQVAGLTNNSYDAESHQVRRCVQKYRGLGTHVLDVAKERLDDMLYVGLTEDHKESATMFANVVGSQVISQLMEKSDKELALNTKPEQNSNISKSWLSGIHLNSSTDSSDSEDTSENSDVKNEDMTVGKLMQAYEGCIHGLRKTQTLRRTNSLKKIAPVNFTKEARRQVPEAVLKQIEELNSLDVELYKHAQKLFAKQHKQTTQKISISETETSALYIPMASSALSWEVLLIALAILIPLLVYIQARRRTSKVKI